MIININLCLQNTNNNIIIINNCNGVYCKTLNISVPLMLAKLAMRYHSLTFVDAKINVYRYACAVVCHVVSNALNLMDAKRSCMVKR